MKKPKVLIIDDNSENREILMLHLRNLPIQLFEAMDSSSTLKEIKKNNFDLILMDIRLPIVSGYDLILKVREYQKQNQISPSIIIAVTANAYPSDKEKCLNLGFDDYLTKPIRKLKIIERVSEVLFQR